jgi:hypothetical protein
MHHLLNDAYTENSMKQVGARCVQNSELVTVKACGTECIGVHNCDILL